MRAISDLIVDLSPEALSEFAMRFKESIKDEPQNQIIARSRQTDTFPVSFAQRRLWLINQLDPDNSTYNMPFSVGLSGGLSVSAIEQGLGEVIRRHEALRTIFRMVDGNLVQTILPASSFRLPIVDLSEHSGERRALEVQRLSLLEAGRPFNLAHGPLLRATLLSLGELGHILLVVMHHIISDGWSMGIFTREISGLYARFSAGADSLLPELPIQYADFSVWQREWFQGAVSEAQLEYWKRTLDGGPLTLELPLDHPRPVIQSYNGATESLVLDSTLTDRLKELSRAEDATLFMTLLAAFSTMLFRYTGQESINVGTPISNRTRDEIEELIGFFVNTLVMRTDQSGEPGFRELLKRVREVALGAYAHQDMPFEKLVEELQPERSLSGSPLFQVMFVLQNAPHDAAHGASKRGGLRLESTAVHTGTAKFDLILSLGEVGDELSGSMEYCSDLFDASTITRMLKHFEVLLQGIVGNPDQQLSLLPMLTEAERQQLLVEWNNTFADYPRSACVHDLFETQAGIRADSTALIFKDQMLSYRELNARANQLAHYLIGKGAGPESVVAICLHRSVEMVVGLLAILKSGAAYLPLDPAHPPQRLDYMMKDAGVTTVLTQQSLAAALEDSAADVVNLDSEWGMILTHSEQAPPSTATADNLAYVTYTSGSTGKPKGICITHRAVVRLTQQPNYCDVSHRDVFLQLAPLAFDASTFEIWVSLVNGARLAVYPDQELSFEELAEVIKREAVSVLWVTTGLFHVMVEGGVERLKGVKQLLTGGEVLSARHMKEALAGMGQAVLTNMYGPTENTTFTSGYPMRDEEEVGESVPIGRPITNTRVYVLGRTLEEVGVGVAGELYTGGDGLARGYLNDAAQTAEKFIPDEKSGERGGRIYRTGDLARYRKDGQIEFIGRKDQQVKIRGFRIEMEEIEAVLVGHEKVKEAIVLAQEVAENDKRIVAYIVSREEEGDLVKELRSLLKEKLPDYMMPSFFVRMDALPLTANGKVDRKALPRPDRERHELTTAFVAPRNQLERKVAHIWMDVSGLKQIGVHDDFFDLGGHSLSATMIISRVREEFNVAIPVRSLFQSPTVAAMSEMITSAIIEGRNERRAPIERVPRDRALPLSYAQRRLWFLQQLEPESPFYNVPGVIRVPGQLSVAALEQAFSEVMRRHEVLRTVFEVVNAEPLQKIEAAQAMLLPVVDLGNLDAEEREAEIQRLNLREAQRVFDLSQGPMLRFRLLRLGPQGNLVQFTMHHIVGDGWSINLFFREITTLYNVFSTGGPSPLAELFTQYADYANWQSRWLEGGVLDAQLDYWKRRMAGAPPILQLPTDRPRPAVLTFEGMTQTVALPDELTADLKRLSTGHGVTLFMMLLTAFQVLMSRYSGQEDIVVGAPIAGRNLVKIENLIGFFINMLVLRTDVSGDPICRDLLSLVQETTLGAYEHQDLPFERLVEEINPERTLSRTPLFQVVFALQNAPKEEASLAELKMGATWTANETSKFDLTLTLVESEERVSGSIHYNTHLFDDSTITRLVGHFETLLKDIAANIDRPISELSLLTDAERNQLLVEWNDIAAYDDGRCIHELIEERIAQNAAYATAVSFGGTQLTYGELNERANRLAHYLQSIGVKPETLVGICMERSLDTIVALLGILKSGGAYLPLEPAYPTERLSFMLEDSRAPVLITQEGLSNRFTGDLQVVCVDSDWSKIAQCPATNPVSDVTPGSAAYVIYTSGSTGKPKGVVVNHSNVARLLDATRPWFDFNDKDVWTWFHSYAFDFSVWEIWGALAYGGRLVIVPYVVSRSPDLFCELLSYERVTVLNQTPSAFNHLITAPRFGAVEKDLNLRYVIFGGEALDLESLRAWFDRRGDQSPRLINMYGITETTVHVTYRPIEQSDLRNSQQSVIGRRIPDLQLYVLDKQMQPVPIGVAGEIHVSGAGVARGYLNRPELTAERFVPNAFSNDEGARLYKTGDLARFLAGGDIEYLGRIDQQVKIRGFRIELGEIESVLRGHLSVKEAVVLANEDASGDRRLVAYVVSEHGPAPSTDELRRFLREKLPDYMAPAVFVMMDELPLTANGKLNRAALPAPGVDRPDLDESLVLPQTKLEVLLSELWSEVLRIEKIGIHDDFFGLGGDSLRAAVLINKLQEKLGEIVHVVVIFSAPTIAELAAYLNEKYADAVSRLCGDPAATPSVTTQIDRSKVERILQLIEPLAPRANGHAVTTPKNPQAIFVLSPPRSGSTLFRVMLAGHPRLFAPPELELLSFNTLEEREHAFTGRNKFWLEGTIRAIMEIKNCDAARAKSITADFLRQRLTTQQFYGQMQEWLGDKVLVDKTPSYALDVEILKRAEQDFESPLYIHLLRHPLAMIRSFEEAKLDQVFFRPSHPFTTRELAALVWMVSHNNILEFLGNIPGHRQHQVKFEELVSTPEATLTGVCEFLGVDLHPDMLQPYKGKENRMTDGIHAGSRMLGDVKFHNYTGIDSNAAAKWKDLAGDDDLGDLIWEVAPALGYEREPKEPSEWDSTRQTLTPIERIDRDDGAGLPLSYAQLRLWFLDQLQPGSYFYNIPAAVRMEGRVFASVLEHSFAEIFRRHETLRTRFVSVDGEPVQVIGSARSYAMAVADLRALDTVEREDAVRKLATEEARRPFDLAAGPLLRTTLLQLGEADYALLLTMHHIISDGWSMQLMIREAITLFDSFGAGLPSPLPELPIQYADFAYWQRQWVQGEVLESQLAYWKRQLGGTLQSIELPTDRTRQPVQRYRGAACSRQIPQSVSDSLKRFTQQEGLTLFMATLAAFEVLLYRYSRQEDISVGTPIAGRNRAEIEGLIGFFVNTLVLRTDLSGEPSFAELLRRVREVAVGAFANQDVPFERLVDELQPERSLSRSPLFQVMFSLQSGSQGSIEIEGMKVNSIVSQTNTAKFDLLLVVSPGDTNMLAAVEYNADLFDGVTIEQMLTHLEVLLEGIVADPGRPISDLAMLTEAERHQLLVEWNNTYTDYPRSSCVHHLFQTQARTRPDSPAVIFKDQWLTYRQLNARANRMAHYLIGKGAGPESVVALCVERSAEMVVALLAILKSGAAYLPLDPAYPKQRLEYMIRDAGVRSVLTRQEGAATLAGSAAEVVNLDAEWAVIAGHSEQDPKSGATADSLACVFYTSGSTGRPKGVCIPHRGVVRLTQQPNYCEVSDTEVFLQFVSLSFDPSVFEIWGSLLNGARLVVYPGQELSFEELSRVIRQEGVSVLWLTAGLFHLMVEAGAERLRGVKQLLAGGDVISAWHVKKALREMSDGKVINGYGPTENSTFTTCYTVSEPEQIDRTVPIGTPINSTQVYVLDRRLEQVAVGIAGELYTGGDGLARGYLNDPALTAEKFMPDGLSGQAGARLYRIGDLVRHRRDGAIEFLGRIDHQVKIRGFRIELEEIEAVLVQQDGVKAAIVLAQQVADNDKRLVAYIVSDQQESVLVEALRTRLKEKLPEYMMPSLFVMLDRLPLTANGKPDRKALLELDAVEPEAEDAYVGPRDNFELRLTQIWQEVLNTHPVGVKENFFDLGGHSLLAVRLMSRLHNDLGIDLPLSTLFQAQTIEEMAVLLRQQSDSSSWSPLVAIERRGSKPPFFCVHPAGGNVFCYVDLAYHLGAHQPFYGLQTPGLDGKMKTYASLEELAACYAEAVRSVQPRGPYMLGGWSLGGVVAFEMAQQLMMQGEEVNLLALIDSVAPGLSARLTTDDDERMLLAFASDLGHLLGVELSVRYDDLRGLGPDEQLHYLLEQAIKFNALPKGTSTPQVKRLLQVFRANVQAARRYRPQVYPGRITLFRASDQPEPSQGDPANGWRELSAGGLEIHNIAGTHYTMIKEPFVQDMAAQLRRCFDSAVVASEDRLQTRSVRG